MEDKNFFEKEPQWEQSGEIRRIQKTIRRRNWKIVSISVILAAVLLTVSVFGVIPWAESLYWNPAEMTYKDRTDLEITLHAYTELFTPGYNSLFITSHRTEFASYELQIPLISTATGKPFTVNGSLGKNVLRLDELFDGPEGKNYVFEKWRLPSVPPTPSEMEVLRERLRELPEYIRLEAKVEFAEDQSMEALLDFREKFGGDVTWVAVRALELSEEWYPICGMDPFSGGIVYPNIDWDYHCFNLRHDLRFGLTEAEQLAQHFISLVQYSADQVEKGRGIAPYGDEGLYADILDYVEENGVKAYGVVVTASPQTLLELLDSEVVYDITLIDGWIDIDWTQK